MTAYNPSQLQFHALRNALYHTARRRSLEFMHRLASMLVIVLGTGVVIDSAQLFNIEKFWFGLATALIGTAQLVMDFAGRARTHELLQAKYYDLLSEMAATQEATPEQIAKWNGQLIKIYGDEPPPHLVLEADVYNEASDALGGTEGERLVVPWRIRVAQALRLPFGHPRFRTQNEIALAQNKKLQSNKPAV